MLEHKAGGKSGRWRHPDLQPPAASDGCDPARQGDLIGLRTAVMTVSDRCYRHETADESGRLLAAYLIDHGAEICETTD